MDKIFLSVIIPVYNPDLSAFKKCVDSISRIRLPMEIIIVDDGSESKYTDSCLKYTSADTRILWMKKENGGVSSARNCGIRKSQGRYLLFVDADDEVTDDFVQFLNRDFDSLNADWILFDIMENHVKTNKKTCRKLFEEQQRFIDSSNQVFDIQYEDVLDLRIRTKKLNESWGKLVSRQLITEGNIEFPVGVLNGEDVIFNTRLLYHLSKVQYVPINAYLYNYNPKAEGRLLLDPYKRYEHLSIGKIEIQKLINHRADLQKKSQYLIIQQAQYIKLLIRDCFVLFEADKLNQQMKDFLEKWIKDNEILKDLSLQLCSGVKLKIYYLILKYRLWFMVGVMAKVRSIIKSCAEREHFE